MAFLTTRLDQIPTGPIYEPDPADLGLEVYDCDGSGGATCTKSVFDIDLLPKPARCSFDSGATLCFDTPL